MAKMAEAAQFVETTRRFFSPNPFDYDALDKLLSGIEEEFDTQACIAGGFIRDAGTFNRPNDIDVFLECDIDKHGDILTNIHGSELLAVTSNDPAYNWAGNLIMQFMRTMEFADEKWPVNLIFLDPSKTITGTKGFWVDHVIRTFDFGICQAGYSINTGMRCTHAFNNDLRDKTITKNPNVEHYRLVDRAQKLKARFPYFSAPTIA